MPIAINTTTYSNIKEHIDHKTLFDFFRSIHPITYEDFKPIEKKIKVENYNKGDLILDKGEIEYKLKFVLSGVVQQYFYIEDLYLTKNFAVPGMCFNNFESYDTGKVSTEIQEAISNVKIISINKKDIEHFLLNDHKFCYIYAKCLQYYYTQREKRSLILLNRSAYKRFAFFMNEIENSNIYLQKISQKKIADYLGITPETLSKVKKEYLENN